MLAFFMYSCVHIEKNHTYVILDKRMYNGKPVHVFLGKN